MKTSTIYKFIFASLLLTGCTKVELCDENTHPHVVEGFSVTYNWAETGIDDKEKPEKLYFVATRILNTRHLVFETNKDGKFWVEKSQTDEPSEVTPPDGGEGGDSSDGGGSDTSGDTPQTRAGDDVVTPPADNTETKGDYQSDIQLPGGEYFMMAFTNPAFPKVKEKQRGEDGKVLKDEEGNDIVLDVEDKRVELINLEEFKANEAIPVKQVKMRHRSLEQKDVSKELVNNRKWSDLNPGIGYVWDAGKKLFVARCDYLELDAGKTYAQGFDFAPLTQHIDIRFTVQLVEDEEGKRLTKEDIQDIYVEMAGIAPEVSISTGILNISELKRTIVQVTDIQDSQTTEDGKSTVTLSCKASLEVFGLVGGVDSYTISGPGVCCIVLYAKTDTDTRAIHAKSNLSKQIKDQGITAETGQVNERKKVKDQAELKIDTPFRIVGLKPEMGSDGVVGWEVVGDIHVEI